MTWDAVGAAPAPIVAVPVGSCEQHGPHLPLDTDTVIASALARTLAERRSDCLVAPPLTVTASGEHAGFPGTLSIGTEVTASVVVELVRSAGWARGVVLVNGHGGNAAAVGRAVGLLRAESREVVAWWPRVAGGDLHAGRTETSMMLALDPSRVRLTAAAAGPRPALGELVRHGVRALSPSGVLGDPSGASAAEGRRLLAGLAADLAATVDATADAWLR